MPRHPAMPVVARALGIDEQELLRELACGYHAQKHTSYEYNEIIQAEQEYVHSASLTEASAATAHSYSEPYTAGTAVSFCNRGLKVTPLEPLGDSTPHTGGSF